MRKLFAYLLAFLVLLFSAALAEAEPANPAAGDWYASIEGVPVTLSLAPDGGYTLALPAAIGLLYGRGLGLGRAVARRLPADKADDKGDDQRQGNRGDLQEQGFVRVLLHERQYSRGVSCQGFLARDATDQIPPAIPAPD